MKFQDYVKITPVSSSSRESQADRFHIPFLAQVCDFEVSSVLLLDPLNALLLGVYHEGPALAVGQDSSVLSGHSVIGQPLIIPGGNCGIIRQHGNHVQAFGHWDGDLGNQSGRQSTARWQSTADKKTGGQSHESKVKILRFSKANKTLIAKYSSTQFTWGLPRRSLPAAAFNISFVTASIWLQPKILCSLCTSTATTTG